MARIPAPFDAVRPALALGWMLAEAQTVIALRLLGMAGIMPSSQDEPVRMVTEKLEAAQEAGMAVVRAYGQGARGAAVVMAGLRPVRRRTRANVKRLSKPKVGR